MASVTLFLVESQRIRLRRGVVVSFSSDDDEPEQKGHDTSAEGPRSTLISQK
jgi:hypothetical protein